MDDDLEGLLGVVTPENWKEQFSMYNSYKLRTDPTYDNGSMFSMRQTFQEAAGVNVQDSLVSQSITKEVSDRSSLWNNLINDPLGSFEAGLTGIFQAGGKSVGAGGAAAIKGAGSELSDISWTIVIAGIAFIFLLAYLPKKGSRA